MIHFNLHFNMYLNKFFFIKVLQIMNLKYHPIIKFLNLIKFLFQFNLKIIQMILIKSNSLLLTNEK